MAIYSRNNDNIDEDPREEKYFKHEDDILAYHSHIRAADIFRDLVCDINAFWDDKIDKIDQDNTLLFGHKKKINELFIIIRDNTAVQIDDAADLDDEEAKKLGSDLESAGCGGLL